MNNLKEIRENYGYSIDEVSEALKIRKQYIVDLEEGTLENIPSEVYARGYLKMYHKFLSIDFPQENGKAITKKDSQKKNKSFSNKLIVLVSTILLVGTILVYSLQS